MSFSLTKKQIRERGGFAVLMLLLAIYLTGFGILFGITFILSFVFGPSGGSCIGAFGLALIWPLAVVLLIGTLAWEGIRRR